MKIIKINNTLFKYDLSNTEIVLDRTFTVPTEDLLEFADLVIKDHVSLGNFKEIKKKDAKRATTNQEN